MTATLPKPRHPWRNYLTPAESAVKRALDRSRTDRKKAIVERGERPASTRRMQNRIAL